LLVASLSFAGKVMIASRTIGTNDVLFWEANIQKLREAGPVALYENGSTLRKGDGTTYHTEVFNQPPFMVHILFLGDWLSRQTQIPFRFWLRFTCAVADLASIMLLFGIIRRTPLRISPTEMLLVAASPLSLMISGFHGNTDPIMVALLLLAVYLAQAGPPWLAGAALGLAAGIKIVPLFFAPALAFYLPGKKRMAFVAGAIGVFFAGALPLVIEHPGLIWSRVFGYSPMNGAWGLSLFVAAFGTEAQAQAYAHIAKVGLVLVLGAISIWLHARKPRTPMVLQCGLLAFVLLSLAPGFGVQYLAWLVPWTCVLSGRQALTFHGSAGLFLVWFYTRAAHGFPWHLANTVTAGVWYGPLLFVGVVCWLVVCWLSFTMFQATRKC
jgi:hypothetical protein